jgi:tetratricopeptide (TPR) repeat protein
LRFTCKPPNIEDGRAKGLAVAATRELVEDELRRVLSWPVMARSPQLAKFLDYVVRAKLSGDEANIKAYAIAVDVFGRPTTFDPQSDPIVRVQARRLRSLLEEYYADVGAGRPLRFNLPVGRYAPDFVDTAAPEQSEQIETVEAAPKTLPEAPVSTAAPPPSRGRPWQSEAALILGGLLAINLLVIAIGTLVLPGLSRGDAPQVPTIAVTEFTTLADSGQTVETDVAGLAVELVTDLQLFDGVTPSYLPPGAAVGDGTAAKYVLTGIARRDGSREQITASLKLAGSDAVLWTETVTPPAPARTSEVDDVSRALAQQLGSHRGPLHAEAMAWLDTHDVAEGQASDYLCGLLFGRYRDSGARKDADRARACLEAVLRREPDRPIPRAMEASLTAELARIDAPPIPEDGASIAAARQQIDAALRASPTDSVIWEQSARLLEAAGMLKEAEAAYASALQLNPANLDAIAAFARMLVLRGPSDRGEALARDALDNAINAPAWYYTAKAVAAFRRGDNVEAITGAEKLVAGDAELGSVIATVAARRIGSSQTLNRYFAQMLDVTRFKRFGIMPVLRQRIGDSALLDEIARELGAAGVSSTALNGTV